MSLSGGALTISSYLAINGDIDGDNKADITIDAAGAPRGLVLSAGTSTLDALAITGANGTGVFISSGAAAAIVNTTIHGNSGAFAGGGILNSGTVMIANSTLSGNSATNYGGGLENYGTATLVNTTVSGNSASRPSVRRT